VTSEVNWPTPISGRVVRNRCRPSPLPPTLGPVPRSIELPAGVPDPNRTARLASTVLFGLVLLLVGWIVLQPGPPDANGQHGLNVFLYHQHRLGLPYWIDFALIEQLSNMLMFLPLGLLGALSLRRSNWLVVPAFAALSGLIELVQLLFLPDRVASVSDVLTNSAGALIGYLLALPLLRRRMRRVRVVVTGRRVAGFRSPNLRGRLAVP
jgi:hypothetical protein